MYEAAKLSFNRINLKLLEILWLATNSQNNVFFSLAATNSV